MNWLARLMGGRPMKFEDVAFVDRVTGKSVCRFTDRMGRRWLAENRWSLFRVEAAQQPTQPKGE